MITLTAPDGVGEITAGDDLVAEILSVLSPTDGDIVVVTSKVVSKAEGRLVAGDREEHVTAETTRLVARRGPTRIVRNRLGLTMAAAGVDASNVAAGTALLLPIDPDGTARRLRTGILEGCGSNVGVVISDTAGRPWREGQTDIAIGAAGLRVAEDFTGLHDQHGNELRVTAPAVADELAGAAELATGKLGGRPFTRIRGRADLVLPAGEDGPGAAALIRPEGADLFGYGAREAVLRALRADPAHALPFGSAEPVEEMTQILDDVLGVAALREGDSLVLEVHDSAGRARLDALAFACGWSVETTGEAADPRIRLRSLEPTP